MKEKVRDSVGGRGSVRGSYLGIDLGTSAVKVIRVNENGTAEKAKATYAQISPEGWYRAVSEAVRQVDTSDVVAVGLSAQVGTYVINGTDVVGWSSGAGREEVDWLKEHYPPDQFVREISMNHPDIISYPIPRLMYFKKHYKKLETVCQPKDLLCQLLTGNWVTDRFSFRGLAHAQTGKFSSFFLKEIGIDPKILPRVIDPTELAGTITAQAARDTGLPEGTPVYTGMNDYYCSLLGMGIAVPGDAFDITGTSEHLGVIQPELDITTPMVSSPYLDAFVHYGVTGSCGVSLDYGIRTFGLDEIDPEACIARKAPIFLPYLNGERAPIFDSDARGVFFGLNADCTKEDMAYAILEGNVFNLYSIWEQLGTPKVEKIVASGGATKNPLLNQLKAELLDSTIVTLEEGDTSALGAVMVAAVGSGGCATLAEAAQLLVKTRNVYKPTGKLRNALLRRYQMYQTLYPTLKESYQTWKEITK